MFPWNSPPSHLLKTEELEDSGPFFARRTGSTSSAEDILTTTITPSSSSPSSPSSRTTTNTTTTTIPVITVLVSPPCDRENVLGLCSCVGPSRCVGGSDHDGGLIVRDRVVPVAQGKRRRVLKELSIDEEWTSWCVGSYPSSPIIISIITTTTIIIFDPSCSSSQRGQHVFANRRRHGTIVWRLAQGHLGLDLTHRLTRIIRSVEGNHRSLWPTSVRFTDRRRFCARKSYPSRA